MAEMTPREKARPEPHAEKVCQYGGCGGTRFGYDPGEIAGQGTEYCVKCHGAQLPEPVGERTAPPKEA